MIPIDALMMDAFLKNASFFVGLLAGLGSVYVSELNNSDFKGYEISTPGEQRESQGFWV